MLTHNSKSDLPQKNSSLGRKIGKRLEGAVNREEKLQSNILNTIHFKCSCNFEVNQTKIKGGCQSGKKVVPHDSKSDLPPRRFP